MPHFSILTPCSPHNFIILHAEEIIPELGTRISCPTINNPVELIYEGYVREKGQMEGGVRASFGPGVLQFWTQQLKTPAPEARDDISWGRVRRVKCNTLAHSWHAVQ